VLDQFEEFAILAKPEQQQKFAAFVAEFRSHPVSDLALLLVLRSDYQMMLEDIGLPSPYSGGNLFQVPRFQLSAAAAFMERSGLDLRPEALDHLLTSAAALDDTPALVRPITLNVIGYVLASGKATAASLDAGALVLHYIEQTVGSPIIRDFAPRILEQMITEQGTKQPCSELAIAATAKFRRAEVRAVLNSLGEAGLARPLDAAHGVWELSHDFIARAVARVLGRRRSELVRRAIAYAAPALLVTSLLGGVWLSQSYLQERMHWHFITRHYAQKHVWPYVLSEEREHPLASLAHFRECAEDWDCPEMVVMPAGHFFMGSPDTEHE
jgi:hypothetical protein